MQAHKPKYDAAEFERRADIIYDRDIRDHYEPAHNGEFVVIDVDSGDFEVGTSNVEITDRLFERRPEAQVWVRRIGSRFVHHYGYRRWRAEALA